MCVTERERERGELEGEWRRRTQGTFYGISFPLLRSALNDHYC